GDEAAGEKLVGLANNESLRDQPGMFQAFQRGTQERGKQLPELARQWGQGLVGKLVESSDAGMLQAGADLAGSIRQTSAQTRLLEMARDRKLGDGPRGSAMSALLVLDRKTATTVGEILVDAVEPVPIRDRAARALGAANSAEARAQLLKALPNAPAAIATAIAFGLTGSRAGGEELLKIVAQGKASPPLL